MGYKLVFREEAAEKALGFGTYEQSIKVGKGSGVITAYYLSQHDVDQIQEIDFEFSGHCDPLSSPTYTCGTAFVQTNVWRTVGPKHEQFPFSDKLWSAEKEPHQPPPYPDSTQGWGFDVYRYNIDWEPDTVSWSVDRAGRGDTYTFLRSHNISEFGYQEQLLYPFISFWWDDQNGWSPDGSKFDFGKSATGECGPSGKCYQAFFFQSLRFIPQQATRSRASALEVRDVRFGL